MHVSGLVSSCHYYLKYVENVGNGWVVIQMCCAGECTDDTPSEGRMMWVTDIVGSIGEVLMRRAEVVNDRGDGVVRGEGL